MRHMRAEFLNNRWDVSLICARTDPSLAVANVRLRQELHERSIARCADRTVEPPTGSPKQAARRNDLANAET